MNVSSLSRMGIVPNDLPVLCLDPPSGCILSYLTGQSFSPEGNKEVRYTFKHLEKGKEIKQANFRVKETSILGSISAALLGPVLSGLISQTAAA